MGKTLVWLVFGLCCEAIGVVLINKGLKAVGGPAGQHLGDWIRVALSALTNRDFLWGLILETMFFVCLCVLMSRNDVSFLWPLTSLGFVITTVAAKCILREHISQLRWAGVLLIVLGAGIITWSEKVAPHRTPPDKVSSQK